MASLAAQPAPAPKDPRAEQKTKEATRRQNEAIEKLRGELKAGRLAICVGSGVTLSSVPGESRLTWTGLIQNGLDFLDDQARQIGADNQQVIDRAQSLLGMKDATTQDILDAATRLQEVLSKRPDLYSDWLKHSFKSLYSYVANPTILDSLKRLKENGASLFTTNYDDLIEKHCHMHSLDRLDTYGMQSFSRGTSNSVFHAHGYWRNAETVVLSARDYWDVTSHHGVQECLKNIFRNKTVLFVGCGAGLADPNFGKLLKWIGEKQRGLGAGHYILLKDGSPNPVTELSLSVLRCESYEDISRWLNDLLDENQRGEDTVYETSKNSEWSAINSWLAPLDQAEFLKQSSDIPAVSNFEQAMMGENLLWKDGTSNHLVSKGEAYDKTIFCASVVKNKREKCQLAHYNRSRDSLGYFFCRTYDVNATLPQTQNYGFSAFCRTVISQLCPPGEVFPSVRNLYTECTRYHPARLPTNRELFDILMEILESLSESSVPTNGGTIEPGDTYLVLDGIDSVVISERGLFFALIRDIVQKNLPHFHLLISCEDKRGMRNKLRKYGEWDEIEFSEAAMEEFIWEYVNTCIDDDADFDDMDDALAESTVAQLVDSKNGLEGVYWKIQALKTLDEFNEETIQACINFNTKKQLLQEYFSSSADTPSTTMNGSK
ncbi:SIR2-like domain-containing protein [Xylariaceae sp. FL0662B]|nr:SIR2-like domain-containing protein [Xylariaceae sp. FL0662B]